MTDEEFRRLMEQARREAARGVFPASDSDDESPYEIAARHAESGAAAH
ncbi:hypothetical protein ABZY16_18330 [Streptomyces sp. NPDC006553]|nr:hypothetical protein [Streptomyces sp. NBC_00233]MCX5231214.1 hypothetical protein [Streptomyces sp. NBC_00233]